MTRKYTPKFKYCFLILLTLESSAILSQTPEQYRSMVMAQNGIVAAESPLAAEAGVMILQSGGNAIDAAIAANAVMGVVAPQSCGIGGDLFAIVFEAKTKKIYGLNASGWSPAKSSLARFKGMSAIPEMSINAVTVPGVVAGWQELLTRFGRKKWGEVLAPAIRLAKDGFPVTEKVARDWSDHVDILKNNSEITKTYLINQQPLKMGQIFKNPNLAWSYEQIVKNGANAFYHGQITEKILQLSDKLGGLLSSRDFADFSPEWVTPLHINYRGWTVYELPPNGQGIAALMMLNIMQRFPLAQYGFGSANTLHIMIEAKKLAYSDLIAYLGDPRDQNLPITELLSANYTTQRTNSIDMQHAHCQVPAGIITNKKGDTTFLSVVDREGNMVALIQSNYTLFGSGLVASNTGFVLQNRGALFSLNPHSPNAFAPHKRPLHTIIPAFMQKGPLSIAFGIMGGWNQAQAHAQFVADIADFGMNIQQALDAPRFTKSTFTGCDVALENRFSPEVLQNLKMRGHILQLEPAFARIMGAGQAVMRDEKSGVNYGASDPRKDGEAIPEVFLK